MGEHEIPDYDNWGSVVCVEGVGDGEKEEEEDESTARVLLHFGN